MVSLQTAAETPPLPFATLQIWLGDQPLELCNLTPVFSGSLDAYLWWKPMCLWFSILQRCQTDLFAIVFKNQVYV